MSFKQKHALNQQQSFPHGPTCNGYCQLPDSFKGSSGEPFFDMFCFKVCPCTRADPHDWSSCLFVHPGEKAARRDPCLVSYTGIACGDMQQAGRCSLGDRCPYAHSAWEYWLHPSRYHTQICKQGRSCCRKACFFAHRPEELIKPLIQPAVRSNSAELCSCLATVLACASPTHTITLGPTNNQASNQLGPERPPTDGCPPPSMVQPDDPPAGSSGYGSSHSTLSAADLDQLCSALATQSSLDPSLPPSLQPQRTPAEDALLAALLQAAGEGPQHGQQAQQYTLGVNEGAGHIHGGVFATPPPSTHTFQPCIQPGSRAHSSLPGAACSTYQVITGGGLSLGSSLSPPPAPPSCWDDNPTPKAPVGSSPLSVLRCTLPYFDNLPAAPPTPQHPSWLSQPQLRAGDPPPCTTGESTGARPSSAGEPSFKNLLRLIQQSLQLE